MTHRLVWFRRDLRIHNNPALFHACKEGGKVTALYIDCPQQWQQHGMSQRQQDFIQAHVQSLSHSLAELGIDLIQQEVADFDQACEFLQHWTQQQGITHLYANREPEINERRRDKDIAQNLKLQQHWFISDTLVPWGQLKTGQGKMYQVFTPFAKAWCDAVKTQGYPLLSKPSAIADKINVRTGQKTPLTFDAHEWPVGEEAALKRLSAFCQQDIDSYSEQRDFPAVPATSRISPYLAIGVLSPAQCLAAIESHYGSLPLNKGEAGFSWLNELIWREFYRHLLFTNPRLCMGKAFKPETQQLKWNDDERGFQAWCDGKTGFPIVDAAMRCLKQSGWMHNRLRMIVASFLTKDLLIDWHRGESWFMSQLLDGDLASNNGGWQWAAGTGADAAPYFRIFNPVTQSERFDPQGEFIKQWLPELQQVPARHVHWPHAWLKQHQAENSYPPPLVDHAEARKEAIARFKAL